MYLFINNKCLYLHSFRFNKDSWKIPVQWGCSLVLFLLFGTLLSLALWIHVLVYILVECLRSFHLWIIRLVVVLVLSLKECRIECIRTREERSVITLIHGRWLGYVVTLRLEWVHGLKRWLLLTQDLIEWRSYLTQTIWIGIIIVVFNVYYLWLSDCFFFLYFEFLVPIWRFPLLVSVKVVVFFIYLQEELLHLTACVFILVFVLAADA